jgi:hypothetical protein
MEIKIYYFVFTKESKIGRMGHMTLSEQDILKLANSKFLNGEGAYPMHIGDSRDDAIVEFHIESVTH